jgi:hypothetical protein
MRSLARAPFPLGPVTAYPALVQTGRTGARTPTKLGERLHRNALFTESSVSGGYGHESSPGPSLYSEMIVGQVSREIAGPGRSHVLQGGETKPARRRCGTLNVGIPGGALLRGRGRGRKTRQPPLASGRAREGRILPAAHRCHTTPAHVPRPSLTASLAGHLPR